MPTSLRLRLLAHLAFWPALAVWTWKLLEPHPVPDGVARILSWLDIATYYVSKALHVLGNTYLTLTLGVWVPCRRRPLTLALVLMLAHGMATEIGQTFVRNRTGSPTDVLIDWAGVALGVLVGWRWWRPAFRSAPLTPSAAGQ